MTLQIKLLKSIAFLSLCLSTTFALSQEPNTVTLTSFGKDPLSELFEKLPLVGAKETVEYGKVEDTLALTLLKTADKLIEEKSAEIDVENAVLQVPILTLIRETKNIKCTRFVRITLAEAGLEARRIEQNDFSTESYDTKFARTVDAKNAKEDFKIVKGLRVGKFPSTNSAWLAEKIVCDFFN